MGRGTHVCIMNTSDVNIEVSYENVSCMFRGGDQGSDFGPISGSISPKCSLPSNKDNQYIEKEANGTCAFNDGYFTMKLTEVSTRKDLAWIKFRSDKFGYSHENTSCIDSRLSVVVDIGSGSKELKVSILPPAKFESVADYPYIDVQFNSNGQLIDSTVENTVIQELKNRSEITDFIVLVHGVNNTKTAAKDIYKNYLEQLHKCQDGKQGIAICGVIWLSQIVDDDKWYDFINFIGNVTKLEQAKDIGKNGLAPFLNAIATKHSKINIHLAGHSMGTLLIRGALHKLTKRIKTVFFIQSPLSANKSLPLVSSGLLDSKLEESYIDSWIHGPIVCTYSNKDSLLGGITVYNPMGEKGFNELSGNNKTLTLRSGTKVSYKDFGKRFVSLDCGDVIGDHQKC